MLDNKSPTEQARIRDELNRLSNTYVAGDEPGFVRKIFGGRSTNDIRNVLNGSFVSSRRKKAILIPMNKD